MTVRDVAEDWRAAGRDSKLCLKQSRPYPCIFTAILLLASVSKRMVLFSQEPQLDGDHHITHAILMKFSLFGENTQKNQHAVLI